MPLRAYLPAPLWPASDLPAPVTLDDAETRHLSSVMRVAPGAPVELLDGAGRIASALVRAASKKHVDLDILSIRAIPPPAPRRILSVALVREQQLDWIIQKAVELGTSEIRLIQTTNCVVRLSPSDFARKLPRWTAVALSACKQSGNPWLPKILAAPSLEKALALRDPDEAGAFGALRPGAIPYARWIADTSALTPPPSARSVWIGPEGDFTPAESDLLAASSIAPVTLGPIVLRVETAALSMLSLLLLSSPA
jgi:16S rRNA (uracil1498-N3)-methyltransferase